MEISEFLVTFLSQDSDTAMTSGLAECVKAVSKTNLGRRLLMLTSTSPVEQRRSRMRVWLKAIKTGRLERWGQRIKVEQGYGGVWVQRR